MREIHVDKIIDIVKNLCIKANYELPQDVREFLLKALDKEESEVGKEVIKQLLENADIAQKERIPICQDTGSAVIFVELGQDVQIVGGNLYEAINEGVRRGYAEGYLRKSIVRDPLRRKNTGDNTPAFIHVELVPGDKMKITVLPKGGGSENMGKLAILTPTQGIEGVKKFVLKAVEEAGPNPCPPVVLGVGIGGTFEYATYLAKKALLRPLGIRHSDPFYAKLEEELIEEINNLGIGPQGLGGITTALDVHVEYFATHITSLPVAVNFNCHATRRAEAEL
ncbi:MAG TPA: fumarate hydratase [candidate division WOR-3 bacterium]|uniref:Fumarate hydratase n=1 Tax=candidate division WOR-3 bacterium TaxID=2052148 RepID=A0A7V5LTC6_UNCW3|nr:fumarate hydratase [candidate division WOR-3 bacterium]